MTLFASTALTACAGVDPTLDCQGTGETESTRRAKVAAAQAVSEAPAEHPYGVAAGERYRVRRLDIAKNDCLTSHQWIDAHGQSINADLVMDLHSAQARCQHLYTNNSYFRGVVNTYARHVVGRSGPTLQVHSDNKQFNEAVEKAYKLVMKMPDPAGRLNGAASLRCAVIHTLVGGSSLFVAKDVRRNGPVTFGWQTLHPRRLVTPVEMAGDENVVLGKRFDKNGRCTTYYIDQSRGRHDTFYVPSGLDCKAVSADLVRHFFIDEEGEQVTGLPLMHTAAKPAADIAEYDGDVMETAKNQAKPSMFVESNNPEFALDPDPMPERMSINRGQANAVPIGWTAKFPTPSQPMAQYVPFRHERLAEIGRPIGMPLILVLLSSIDGNFAQAQFDGALYAEGIDNFQGELDWQVMDWDVENIVTELVLGGVTERPSEYSFTFGWPKPPHANIEKVVKALRMLVEDGHIAPEHATQIMGYDWEEVVKCRQKNAEQLEEAGLPPSPVNRGTGALPNPEEGEEGDGDEPPAKKKDKSKEERHASLA